MAVGAPWTPAPGGDDGYLVLEDGSGFILQETFLFFGRFIIEASAARWENVSDVVNGWAEEAPPSENWQPV